ncbi:tetratricopeptide repeat protein [Kineosporia succinea]|uniref:HTH cro/C1-type domain-containing protein n=1 Tax=Kineosporia succinea TaxID=84632 RepID=A0ABT9PCP7_9ACTN|nr:tetratricopeptide repeat protein [Kineosporia succinea]MDP9830463.1 hypothetical protein [Kineosporia succinea]
MSEAWHGELRDLLLTLHAHTRGRSPGGLLSMREIGAASGLSSSYVADVLRGRRRPQPGSARALALAVGADPAEADRAVLYAERMHDGAGAAPAKRVRLGAGPLPPDCEQPRKALSRRLSPGRGRVRTTVLTGLSGVGKTQVARAYADGLWRENRVDVVLWVNAAHHDSVVDAYAEAARRLTGTRDHHDVAAARRLLDWTATTRRTWLVVLDDLQSPQVLAEWAPRRSARGQTLVTTRRRDHALTGGQVRVVTAEAFSPPESQAYLRAKFAAAPERAAGAQALAADLGHLPVVLAQAAAYIDDRALTCDLYRERLRREQARLAGLVPETDALPDGQRLAYLAAWSLSIALADTLTPRNLARPLLEIAALLDPNGIPARIFEEPAVEAYVRSRQPRSAERAREQGQPFADAVRCLHRLNLVTDGDGRVRVHALVQRATRESLPPQALTAAARAGADAVNGLLGRTGDHDPAKALLRAGALALHRHAGRSLVEGGMHPLLPAVTADLGRTGQVHAALALALEVHASGVGVLGEDHPDTLAARSELTFWQGHTGAPAAALAAMRELVTAFTRLHGPHDPRTLKARHEQAGWRARAGGIPEAISEFRALLDDRIRHLGPDDPDTLHTRNSLAAWQGYAGDAPAAVRELRTVLADRTRRLGPDAPDTLDTRHHLAQWIGEAGDGPAAVEMFRKLLVERTDVLGPDHRDTLATRYRLALWRGRTGAVAQAVEELRAVARRSATLLGPANPDTLTVRFALAGLRGGEDPAAAVRELRAVLDDQMRVLEPDHPDLAGTRTAIEQWEQGHRDGGRPAA